MTCILPCLVGVRQYGQDQSHSTSTIAKYFFKTELLSEVLLAKMLGGFLQQSAKGRRRAADLRWGTNHVRGKVTQCAIGIIAWRTAVSPSSTTVLTVTRYLSSAFLSFALSTLVPTRNLYQTDEMQYAREI